MRKKKTIKISIEEIRDEYIFIEYEFGDLSGGQRFYRPPENEFQELSFDILEAFEYLLNISKRNKRNTVFEIEVGELCETTSTEPWGKADCWTQDRVLSFFDSLLSYEKFNVKIAYAAS